MKTRICFCLVALALLPSCVSSTLATAAMAGSGIADNIPGVRSLLGNDAPQPGELVGYSLDYSGKRYEAGNVSHAVSGSILFGSDNPSVVRLADGTVRTVAYSRVNDTKATVTITTPDGVETYRLTFTGGKGGSYTYEKRHGADFASGEGEFSLQ